MSTADRHTTAAFTGRDLVVVIAVVFVLGLLLLPELKRSEQRASRISCNGRLMCIGTAYRIWANQNHGFYPACTPQTNGGWSDFLSLTNAGSFVWTNYATMAAVLTTRILVCPADERRPATAFSNLVSNTNISYFVGVNASDRYPQLILSGDRNIGPGTTPDTEYGFSPASGRGNDVTITKPVCWSLKMHSYGNPTGVGDILLGDGSLQQTTSRSLYEQLVENDLEEKAGKMVASRLIFP